MEPADTITPTFWEAPEIAKAGYKVFPIAPGEKNPSVSGAFYASSTDLDKIAYWINEENRGHHNIGIATGFASDLVVLEADTAEDYARMHARFGEPTVKSSHKHKAGGHWYFAHPADGKVKSTWVGDAMPGAYCKGDGGYVLAPPSTRKVWTNGIPDKATLPSLPKELRDALRDGSGADFDAGHNGHSISEFKCLEAAAIVARHVAGLDQGDRHDHLKHTCGALLRQERVGQGDAEAILTKAWQLVGGVLAERAAREVPNTIRTTIAAIAEGRATGVPHMEELTPGLFEELERTLGWDSANSANSANGNQNLNEDPEPWSPPAAFHSYKLPEFPHDVFPSWMSDYTEALAESTQTPRDLPGMLGITIGALISAKIVQIEVWSGWTEPANLSTATALRSGSRKTTVFERMCAPVEEYEAWLIEDTAQEIAEQRTKYHIYEGRLKKTEQRAAKSEGDDLDMLTADAMQAASDLESIKVPAEPRLLVDDASPERLAALLAEQGGRIALMSAEGGVFDMMAGRYSQGIPNLDVYLKGHAGDALRVDRVGRAADFVRRPALTTGLAVQPDVLRGLASKPGFRGRGLLGRFQYAMPRDTLGSRRIRTEPVPCRVETEYAHKIKYILGLSPKLPDGEREPHTLRFSPEAQDGMERLMSWLEPRLAEGADFGDMTDWAGKLAGAVARIAGILHMLDYAGKMEPWKYEVSADTFRRAVKVGRYLIPHAKYALAFMGSDPTVEDAKYILRWVERKDCEWFTKREAFEGTKGRFGKVSELEPGLELLIAHGYIREDPSQPRPRGPGRKPSPRYEVNPLIKSEHRSQNSHNSQNGAA
jgi:replicative DNA helicase